MRDPNQDETNPPLMECNVRMVDLSYTLLPKTTQMYMLTNINKN